MSENVIDIKSAAEKLAQQNFESVESITKIYWFPHESQIRLVEVDDTFPPGDNVIEPYYFSPVQKIPYVSGIALITPDQDEMKLSLPDGWGTWESAKVLFDRTQPAA